MTFATNEQSSLKTGLPDWLKWLPYYVLFAVVWAVYANSFDNAFLYDDDLIIIKNTQLRDWHMIGSMFATSVTGGANVANGFYRPLQLVLYFIIFQLFGLTTIPFHILNTCLHAINGCMVYKLGRKLTFNGVASFVASLLWVLHPLHTEAVTYISATADPLYALCCMAGILILLPDFSPRRMAMAVPIFVIGLLSKETAITFPLLVIVTMFYVNERERWRPQFYLRTWPLWIVVALYLLCRHFFLNFDSFVFYTRDDVYATSVACRIYTFFATLPYYASLLVWPTGLHIDRNFPLYTDPFDPDVMGGIIIALAMLATIFLCARTRARGLSWGCAWFFAAHLLHSGILKPVNSIFLEHWLYLPSVGLWLGLADTIANYWPQQDRLRAFARPAACAVVAVIAIGFAQKTMRQNMVWHDSVSLYTNIFANGEVSAHAHNNLGVIYTKQGRLDLGLAEYRAAIAASKDTDAQSHHNYAITLLHMQDGPTHMNEAVLHFKKALEIDPDFYPAADALADLYKLLGNEKSSAQYKMLAGQIHARLAPLSGTPQPIPVSNP